MSRNEFQLTDTEDPCEGALHRHNGGECREGATPGRDEERRSHDDLHPALQHVLVQPPNDLPRRQAPQCRARVPTIARVSNSNEPWINCSRCELVHGVRLEK